MSKSSGSNNQSDNWYDVLGLAVGASSNDIRKAYLQLAKEHHPDLVGDSEAKGARFKQISEAYAVLSDDIKRKAYDVSIGRPASLNVQDEQAGQTSAQMPKVSGDSSVANEIEVGPRPVPPEHSGGSVPFFRYALLGAAVSVIGIGYLAFSFLLLDLRAPIRADGSMNYATNAEKSVGETKSDVLSQGEDALSQGVDSVAPSDVVTDRAHQTSGSQIADEGRRDLGEVDGKSVERDSAEAEDDVEEGGVVRSSGPKRVTIEASGGRQERSEETRVTPEVVSRKEEPVGGGRVGVATSVEDETPDAKLEAKADAEAGGSETMLRPPIGFGLKAPDTAPVPVLKPTRVAEARRLRQLRISKERAHARSEIGIGERDRAEDWRFGDEDAPSVGDEERSAAESEGRYERYYGEEPDYSTVPRRGERSREPDYSTRPGAGEEAWRDRVYDRAQGREQGDLQASLPDGAGFGRWVISGGQLCWIRWNGGLTCGDALTSLSDGRKRALIDRIRRHHKKAEGRTGPRYGDGFGQPRRPIGPRQGRRWVNEFGMTCWYDREGFEVCERY